MYVYPYHYDDTITSFIIWLVVILCMDRSRSPISAVIYTIDATVVYDHGKSGQFIKIESSESP